MNHTSTLDVRRLVAETRGRLTRRRRVEGCMEGLALAAGGVAVTAAWQAAVEPSFPWDRVAPFIAAAGLLPYVGYALRVTVSSEQAAWYLDRRLGAGGRLLALVEDPGDFRGPLEREVQALHRAPDAADRRGLWRRGRLLGAALAGLVFVRLLAPEVPVLDVHERRSAERAVAEAATRAFTAEQLAVTLAGRGESRLADGLAGIAPRLRRGERADGKSTRLARTVDERLRREEQRAALRNALGDTPAGRALASRLAAAGDGTAVTQLSPETAALLARAATDTKLPASLQRDLARAAAAAKQRDAEAFATAASAVREALGAALSPRLLAEASELLATLEDGGSEPAPFQAETGEKPGIRGDPAVRGPNTSELVFDPDLRRVIRRYFLRRQRHE